MRWFHKLQRQYSLLLVTSIVTGLASCQNSGYYITPPGQTFSGTLNTIVREGGANFSHDGRYLVFHSDRNSQRSIYLYDLQSSRLVNLPGLNKPGSMQFDADLSADGRYIVYVSEELGKTDIFVYDRAALNSENITKNLIGEVRNPTISGNGRLVAFESNRNGQWDVEIYDRGLTTDLSLPKEEQGNK
ncbi:MAG: TolB family protein [Pleurocapsa sp.]